MHDASPPFRLFAVGLFLLLCAALVLAGCGAEERADDGAEEAPDVLVTVNGLPITQSEVDAFLKGMMRFGGSLPPERMVMLRKQFGPTAEKKLIEQKLLEAAAAAGGFAATAEEVAGRWQEIERSLPPDYTMEQHLARSELSKAEAEVELGRMIALEKLMAAEASPPSAPSDEEARAYFETNKARYRTPEQVHARHILLPVEAAADEATKAATRATIEDLRAQIVAGAKFEDLAREHSTCSSRTEGGSLGFFGRGRMAAAFEEAAFALEPGVVSEPVETQFGFHLIRVDEKRSAGDRTFDEVKDTIKTQLHDQARQDARRAYVEALRKTATIKRRPGPGA